jgi:hypothetical protein
MWQGMSATDYMVYLQLFLTGIAHSCDQHWFIAILPLFPFGQLVPISDNYALSSDSFTRF